MDPNHSQPTIDIIRYLETSINLLMIHNFRDTIPYLGEIILIIPCSGELDHLRGEVYHV